MQDLIMKRPQEQDTPKSKSDMLGHILVLNDEKARIQAYYRPDEGFDFFRTTGKIVGNMVDSVSDFIGSIFLPKEPSNLDKAIELVNHLHKLNIEKGIYAKTYKTDKVKIGEDKTYNGWSNYETWHTNLFYSDIKVQD